MGSLSRQKGKRGERECAAEMAAVFALTYGVDARRGVQHQGGPDSPDVVLDGIDVHVEAKRVEALNVYKALEQAKTDAGQGKVPIVWHRRNGKGSVVIVDVVDLVALANAIVDARRKALDAEIIENNAAEKA
jgi:hypothetical protein